MGRKAGVSASDTREALLAAAARVFAAKGYEGASIAQIAADAGLSSGAIYAHWRSKAELFAATLVWDIPMQYERLLGRGVVGNFADFVKVLGSFFGRHSVPQAALVLEAVAAAKRDADVSTLVSGFVTNAEQAIAEWVSEAQDAGLVDEAWNAQAIGRFLTLVTLGNVMVAALDLDAPDQLGWSALIDQLVDSVRPR